MSPLRLVEEHDAPNGARQVVEDGLNAYNIAATGESEYYPVAIFLKDDHGVVHGGVLGDVWSGWLHISYLWIDTPFRDQGFGSRLLRAAESYVRERGCLNVCLETHSFQAPAFYQKHGYEIFGTLPDFPLGHAKYFLRKRLTS
jgi:ribosomal protein S18 acetylase RimI-like enzyme